MADEEQPIVPTEDVEMAEENTEGAATQEGDPTLGDIDVEEVAEPKVTFLDYLKSPIVELIVGTGDAKVTLSAHEALLKIIPVLAEKVSSFTPRKQRRIDLTDEDVDAVGSVVENIYNGEYFPKRVSPASRDSALEVDPSLPKPDVDGVGLLRHARIYTLADRLNLPELNGLAHSKIHSTESTAKGEIAYARYVYQNTNTEDNTIRRPVAAFWANRSHFLRHQADDEFRQLCIEFPVFSFDVLSIILDQCEKKDRGAAVGGASVEVVPAPTPGTVRKRRRGTDHA